MAALHIAVVTDSLPPVPVIHSKRMKRTVFDCIESDSAHTAYQGHLAILGENALHSAARLYVAGRYSMLNGEDHETVMRAILSTTTIVQFFHTFQFGKRIRIDGHRVRLDLPDEQKVFVVRAYFGALSIAIPNLTLAYYKMRLLSPADRVLHAIMNPEVLSNLDHIVNNMIWAYPAHVPRRFSDDYSLFLARPEWRWSIEKQKMVQIEP